MLSYLFVNTEAVTPLIVEAQKQFHFSHILADASAFGKVCINVFTANVSRFFIVVVTGAGYFMSSVYKSL